LQSAVRWQIELEDCCVRSDDRGRPRGPASDKEPDAIHWLRGKRDQSGHLYRHGTRHLQQKGGSGQAIRVLSTIKMRLSGYGKYVYRNYTQGQAWRPTTSKGNCQEGHRDMPVMVSKISSALCMSASDDRLGNLARFASLVACKATSHGSIPQRNHAILCRIMQK
jgi:hypothetical protein